MIKTCFISASSDANLKTLREVLEEKGVNVIVPEQLPPGSSWAMSIKSILSEVDLVIGVMTRARDSNYVLFELGLAWALNRQIILFAPPSYAAIPSNLQQFLVIRASLNNKEAISFAIDQLLAAPAPHRKFTSLKAAEVHSLGKRANDILSEINDATAARQGYKPEELVAHAIRESGVDVIAESSDLRHRADLAIWSDALQPHIGNPLLVEIKLQVLNAQDARRAFQQLSAALVASGAAWGLLLYGKGPENGNIWKGVPPNVLIMSLSTLMKQMESRAFVDIIREQRNRRAHGERP